MLRFTSRLIATPEVHTSLHKIWDRNFSEKVKVNKRDDKGMAPILATKTINSEDKLTFESPLWTNSLPTDVIWVPSNYCNYVLVAYSRDQLLDQCNAFFPPIWSLSRNRILLK